jgi:hypothetical protein
VANNVDFVNHNFLLLFNFISSSLDSIVNLGLNSNIIYSRSRSTPFQDDAWHLGVHGYIGKSYNINTYSCGIL